jgi:hypothetical protein
MIFSEIEVNRTNDRKHNNKRYAKCQDKHFISPAFYIDILSERIYFVNTLILAGYATPAIR